MILRKRSLWQRVARLPVVTYRLWRINGNLRLSWEMATQLVR